MKVTGIIAEYNPLHKGHQYHLNKAREMTGADYLVVVMSGNYTQRGLPAITDKYVRARAALVCGADLVLELPTPYATGSAEYFASGAVALLDHLGVVDTLCFGSECGDIEPLAAAGTLLCSESVDYRLALREFLARGDSYPAARQAALVHVSQKADSKSVVTCDLLGTPNNLLGIEYCKALARRNSSITPVTLKREGAGYHEETLSVKDDCSSSESNFCSASALRKTLLSAQTSPGTPDWTPLLSAHMPAQAVPVFEQAWQTIPPISQEDFSLLLHARLLEETADTLTSYLDVSGDLADKIIKHLPRYTDFSDFCNLLKSRDLTHTRLSRSLLHILLGIRKAHMQEYVEQDYLGYARVLGFCPSAQPLLAAIKANAAQPLVTKLADAREILESLMLRQLEDDIRAAHLYEAVCAHKASIRDNKRRLQNEYSRQIIIAPSHF